MLYVDNGATISLSLSLSLSLALALAQITCSVLAFICKYYK